MDRASLASSNSESSTAEDIYDDLFVREEEERQEGGRKEEGTEPGEPALDREYILNSTHLQDIVGAQKVQCVGGRGHVWVFLPL